MNVTKAIRDNHITLDVTKDAQDRDDYLYTVKHYYTTSEGKQALVSTTVEIIRRHKREGYYVANWGRGDRAPWIEFKTMNEAKRFAIADLLEVHAAAVAATK